MRRCSAGSRRSRHSAEELRQSADTVREQLITGLADRDKARQIAEAALRAAERVREAAEQARLSADTVREGLITNLVSADDARAIAEAAREAAERVRGAAEQARETNEALRKAMAEQWKVTQEVWDSPAQMLKAAQKMLRLATEQKTSAP